MREVDLPVLRVDEDDFRLVGAGLGVVGFLDDYLKISQQDSTGLRPRYKLVGQFLVATGFAVMALLFPDENGNAPASTHISFVRDIPWLDLAFAGSIVGFLLFAILAAIMVATRKVDWYALASRAPLAPKPAE